jgi:hypothetical protein
VTGECGEQTKERKRQPESSQKRDARTDENTVFLCIMLRNIRYLSEQRTSLPAFGDLPDGKHVKRCAELNMMTDLFRSRRLSTVTAVISLLEKLRRTMYLDN